MSASRRMAGVYQPRSRKAALSEALVDLKVWLNHLMSETARRGFGIALLLGALAFVAALASFDGADFAAQLWAETGIKVMPGAYMGIEEKPGDLASNPGHSYVRIALVHDLVTIERALERMANFLLNREGQSRGAR